MSSSVRIGLIVPSSNTVMEVDLYRRLPHTCGLHTARMLLEDTTPEGESIMLDRHVMPAARDLATAHPDVVIFGCTSAGALRGDDFDRDLCGRISDVTRVPTLSVIASVREAIRMKGAGRVGVITPYIDALNQKIRDSLIADGIEVAGIRGLGISDNFEIASVTPEEIVEFARSSFGGASIDLLFASCTNFHAMDAVEELERKLGVPVVTSNQATFEAVVRAVGPDEAEIAAG